MNNFNLLVNTQILFGKGMLGNLADEIKKYGSRVLIMSIKEPMVKIGLYGQVIGELKKAGLYFQELGDIVPNPRISSALAARGIIEKENLDFILAIGGGSVIDCAKITAVLACNEAQPAWEMVEKGLPVEKALPLGVISTLAATGSEMNGGAVISNEETKQKLVFESNLIRPRFAIMDPAFTLSVPKNLTGAGVIDIFSHVMEQYFSHTPNVEISDGYAETLMRVTREYGYAVMENLSDYTAREGLLWAAALATNGTLTAGRDVDWGCHMLAHEISALRDTIHGFTLGILHPRWMSYSLNEKNRARFVRFAEKVWGLSDPEEAIEKTRRFFIDMDSPATLRDVGITEKDIPLMAEKATRGKTVTLGNFQPLTFEDAVAIYQMAF